MMWVSGGRGPAASRASLQADLVAAEARTALEQQLIDLQLKLQDRDDDLAAARAANRELMAQLNRGRETPPSE
jgi:hypothetical protein